MKDERGKMKEDLKIESFLNRMAEKHKANAMKIKEIKFCHSENLCHFVLLSLNKKQKSEQPMWIARSILVEIKEFENSQLSTFN